VSDDASVTHWIDDLKSGAEGDAQQRIWERYFGRLVALARNKLRPLRGYEDEEDVVLSAMNSFFVRASRHEFPRLSDRTGLWPLLVRITVCKVADAQRRQFREKSDVRRTLNLDSIVGREPSLGLATELVDGTNRLLEGLNDELLRQIARLKLEGYTNQEIAEKIGKSVKTVERKLSLIREHFSRGEIE